MLGRLFLAYIPVASLLLVQSWSWPRNWDDLHRGFNGIDPAHNLFAYGLGQSQQMLKLLVHDPALTWSNQLDYRHPLLSGLLEIGLLLAFMAICTAIALYYVGMLHALILVVSFNVLTGTQASTFLPPAAYPIGFSLFFLVSIIGSLRFDSIVNDDQQQFTSGHGQIKSKITSLIVIFSEQISFLFYSCNYVQSSLFWFLNILWVLAANSRKIDASALRLHLLA